MPRKARFILPNTPHHIVQRGHNRSPVFTEAIDFNYYLASLIRFKKQFGVKVYSFCLMTNHIHLIVEPGDDVTTISKLMKRLAGRQTRLVNKLENRSGSLWEGRYKISAIQTEAYLLQCCRYVELNPVKAKIVVEPQHYSWSSFRSKIGLDRSDWLDLDEAYLGLSSSKLQRQLAYRKFVEAGEGVETEMIREAVSRNQLTGSAAFINEIELRTGARIESRGRGRPPRAVK